METSWVIGAGRSPACCSILWPERAGAVWGESLNQPLNGPAPGVIIDPQLVTAAPRVPASALVGRAAELVELDQVLDRAGAAGWFLQIAGEPGIGKSRLLAELRERAARRGWLVLTGRAAELELDLPFALLTDALDDGLTRCDPEALQPLAAAIRGEPPPRSLPDRHGAYAAIRSAFEELARHRRVLLALDDLHWADEASLEVVAHLLRRCRGPLVVAVAFRRLSAGVAASLAAAGQARPSSTFELGPLSRDDGEALLDSVADAGLREELYRESGGNPFYLEQLARLPRRPLVRSPEAEQAGPDEWTPPAAVRAALHEELTGLDAEARRTLDAAAIAGDSVDVELVAAIAGQSRAEALAAFQRLLEAELVRPTEVPGRFRFRHPIVRRAIYDATSVAWRLDAHARAARARRAARASTSAVAHHVERSATTGDDEAIALLSAAARAAAPRAPLAAGRWLQAAVRLLPDGGDADLRLSLLVEAGLDLAWAGAHDEALPAFEEALALLPAARACDRARLVARIAGSRRRCGRPFASRAALEDALRAVAGCDEGIARDIQVERAIDALWHARFDVTRSAAAEVMRTAREEPDPILIALAAALTSLADAARGRIEPAQALLVEAHAAFRAVTDDELVQRLSVSFYVALAALRLEAVDDALADIGRGLDLARVTGQDAMVSSWLAFQAHAALLRGEVAEAEVSAAASIDRALLAANDWRTLLALEARALAAYWAGDPAALAAATELVSRVEQGGFSFLETLARVQLAAAREAAGDASAVEAALAALVAEAPQALDRNAALGWHVLVNARLALGDVDGAAICAAIALARADARHLPVQAAIALSARAAVELARGAPQPALEAARAASAAAAGAANAMQAARARMLAGRALVALDGQAQALDELVPAEATLRRCGAIRDADAAAREIRRLGRRVPRRPAPGRTPPGLLALSARENEVAAQVAAGKTNREIAGLLFLSEKTIESHLGRIYAKLGVHSRASLAVLVEREGDRVR
jgi:DNA-binding CsgD family transcriptional regulator